jgi:hypothetical protein
VPEEALDLLTYWDEALLVALTEDLEHALLQPEVIHF